MEGLGSATASLATQQQQTGARLTEQMPEATGAPSEGPSEQEKVPDTQAPSEGRRSLRGRFTQLSGNRGLGRGVGRGGLAAVQTVATQHMWRPPSRDSSSEPGSST